MRLKSPTEPIEISEDSSDWLDAKLKRNSNRKRLNKKEKELLKGSMCFDEQVKSF